MGLTSAKPKDALPTVSATHRVGRDAQTRCCNMACCGDASCPGVSQRGGGGRRRSAKTGRKTEGGRTLPKKAKKASLAKTRAKTYRWFRQYFEAGAHHPQAYAGTRSVLGEEPRKDRADKEAWLASQTTHQIHRPSRKNYPRRAFVVHSIDEMWQLDLSDMQWYKGQNDGHAWILFAIDDIFREVTAPDGDGQHGLPRVIYVDRGKEFYNRHVGDLLAGLPIPALLQSGHDHTKAAVVERVQRTIKTRLWKRLYEKGDSEWVTVLPAIVDSYNHARHATLKRSPASITRADEEAVWKTVHGARAAERETTPLAFGFAVGDTVRISRQGTLFRKGYLPRWSEEWFRVRARDRGPPPHYRLEDLQDEPVEGLFYEPELQKVTPEEQKTATFRVEKVIKRRGARGELVEHEHEMNEGEERRPFVRWFESTPDPNRSPRTTDNTQDEFVVVLDRPWSLRGDWSVRVLDCSLAEVHSATPRRDLLLYSHVIVYEIVGYDKFPLLDWLPYHSNRHLRHQQSRHPFRRRVAVRRLESIGFKIVDVEGRVPVFRSTVPTLICLEFEPQPPDFDETLMEYTFLSNQSRDLYKDNHPARFVAQLPTPQRMDRGRWEVGLVKLTLPPTTLVRAGEWFVGVTLNYYKQKEIMRVEIDTKDPPKTIEALLALLNRKIRERSIVRLATVVVGDDKKWVLTLSCAKTDTLLKIDGTFLERLGFADQKKGHQWKGPVKDEETLTYRLWAKGKLVRMETGWLDPDLDSMEVYLSKELTALFQLESKLGPVIIRKPSEHSLPGDGPITVLVKHNTPPGPPARGLGGGGRLPDRDRGVFERGGLRLSPRPDAGAGVHDVLRRRGGGESPRRLRLRAPTR
ncbi:hypothetical protein QZH41_005715 [Actinostola sp. cb2023]|nr:hypothetical protein QZH41_005715 [Actinostola sp. cb2023]